MSKKVKNSLTVTKKISKKSGLKVKTSIKAGPGATSTGSLSGYQGFARP